MVQEAYAQKNSVSWLTNGTFLMSDDCGYSRLLRVWETGDGRGDDAEDSEAMMMSNEAARENTRIFEAWFQGITIHHF